MALSCFMKVSRQPAENRLEGQGDIPEISHLPPNESAFLKSELPPGKHRENERPTSFYGEPL